MTLTEKREKFGKLGDRIGELRAKLIDGTLTDDESRELDQALPEFNDLGDELTRAEMTEKASAKFAQANQSRGRVSGQLGAQPDGNGATEPRQDAPRSVGEAFAKSDELAEMLQNGARASGRVRVSSTLALRKQGAPEQRAIISSTGQPGYLIPDMVVPGIFAPRDYDLTMRDVLLTGQTTSDTIYFLRELLFTNAAVEVAEATVTTGTTGTKPESALTFEQASTAVATIAHWVPITRQMLADAPQVRDYLEGRLTVGLERRLDAEILNGNGTAPNMRGILQTSGIQALTTAGEFTTSPVIGPTTGVTANLNRIARAIRLIDTAGDAVATFAVMNPVDIEKIQTGLDTTNNYMIGNPLQTGAVPRIWGLNVVKNRNIAAGTALVGDGTMAQVWQREDANVLADTVNDQFIRNMLTVLAELRAALAVYRPLAFASVQLT